MIEEENEKRTIRIRRVCLESLTTELYFTSDDHPYHSKCFSKLNFKKSNT